MIFGEHNLVFLGILVGCSVPAWGTIRYNPTMFGVPWWSGGGVFSCSTS